MSIIRYTPLQDAFIVSGTVGQTLNTGLDEMLQIGVCNRYGVEGSARTLLDFGHISLPVSTSKVVLHLSLANAYNLPAPTYSIKACPVSESWQEGCGKLADEPATKEGVCWNYRTYSQEGWKIAGGDFTPDRPYVTQSFNALSAKDINVDVLRLLQSESCDNGFILGFTDESGALASESSLLFYSKDTHTVYRPYLEIQVNDAEYSSSLQTATTEQITIVPEGLKSEHNINDNVRIQLNVCPKYPTRLYSTSSLYNNVQVLPQESYWGVCNEYTREMIVDFCEGTRISANDSGSYFDFNVSLLEPGRYYRLLYQVNLGGNRKITFDNRNIFKVVKHV